MPTWWNVFTIPEAAPALSPATPAMPAEVIGAKARPCPAPTSTIGSATASQYEPGTETRLSQAIPIRVSVTPAASGTACPSRGWPSRRRSSRPSSGKRHPSLERGKTEHALQVLGAEVEESDHRAEVQQPGQVGADAGAAAEQ